MVIYLYLDIIWEVSLGRRNLTTSRHLGTMFIVPFILFFICLPCSYILVYLFLVLIFCSSSSPLFIALFIIFSIVIYIYIYCDISFSSLLSSKKYFLPIFPKWVLNLASSTIWVRCLREWWWLVLPFFLLVKDP